MRKLKLGLV